MATQTHIKMDITLIWNTFHRELRAFIARTIRNQADTDDLLQEVFIKILKNEDRLHAADNLKSYLYAMVKNTINDYFRNLKNHTDATELSDFSEEEAHDLNTAIAECCIRPFIQKLPEKYREALTMAELNDISQKEVADRLDLSYSGAKSRIQRGRLQLKEMLLQCCTLKSDIYGNLSQDDEKPCGCS